MKTQSKYKSAFTLVELAIVMTIIGLLIGGILKGQELLDNARVIATISQLQSVTAAVITFDHKYGGLPGDIKNAERRITGCNANCAVAADEGGCGGAGCGWDGKLGHPEWGGTGWVNWSCAIQNPPSDWSAEYDLFWLHLVKANLISGTQDITAASGPSVVGVSQPASKMGGVLYPGWADGTALPGSTAKPEGLVYVVAGVFPACHEPIMTASSSSQAMSPVRAAQLDRKIDDGFPVSGSVLSYGVTASCALVEGNLTIYNGAETGKHCGLVVRPLK